MAHTMKTLSHAARAGLIALLAITLPILAQAAHHEEPQTQVQDEVETSGRAMAIELVAEVTAIDLETREVTLQGPEGDSITIVSPETVAKLEDVSVGDLLVVTYISALEGELREPTEEELAEPWLELKDSGISDDPDQIGAAGARIIRAVVTIEGMNRALGIVTVKDSRGKLHMIGDVEAQKMEGVTLGQTLVLVFREALAMSLEKHQPASE
jgi:hypothetical protein